MSAGGAGGLEEIAARAVEAALAAGAGQAEAWSEQITERNIRVYEGEVESLTDATSRGLGVRVITEGRSGYSFGTELTETGATEVARAAHEAAAVCDADPHAGLPEESGSAELPDLASSELEGFTTQRKVELALEIERAARGTPGVSQVEETAYADAHRAVALVNSLGLRSSFASTSAWAYASAFAGEGSDLMTGIGVGIARDPSGLDAAGIGREAAERALALVGARQPASRRCPVVLDPFVAAAFVGIIGGMLSADAVQRGRSPFAGREGEEVAAQDLRLVDDGLHPLGLATAPFDGEGSPSRRTPLIEGGRLASFLYDARTARRARRATTASASRASYRSAPVVGAGNLVLEPGERDLGSLLAHAGEGLYVTDVVGLHSGVNPVSGTFSVGASGRLIRGGELAEPVREITVASDLESMLRAVDGVGRDGRWLPFGGSVLAPPLALREMVVSGG